MEITMADKLRRTQFLGREFLTWLLFKSYRNDGLIALGDDNVEVYFERAVTLDGDNPAREMATIKVDEPTQSEEVRLSLKLGKKVSRARISIVIEGKEYVTTIDSATLGLKSLRLPDVKDMDFAEIMEETANLTDAVEDVIQGLFVTFVKMRLDETEWSHEAEAISHWIDTDDILG